MRKTTLLFLMMLALGVSAQPISEQEALQKAQQFLQGKNIVSPVSQGQLRRATTAHPYQHLYMFNVENNGGFVIVSGDSRAREILAYSEEGNLDYSQMPENMKWWLSLYDESIASIPDDLPVTQESALHRASKADVAPMMSYSWSQNYPYNAHCPQNCVSGCVPTAIAQMLAFHGNPTTLPSISGYSDENGHYLEALSSRSINYSNMTADDAAWLVRYAGQAIRANYGQTTTGAVGALIPITFVNVFGYGQNIQNIYRNAYSSTDWDDLLYNELSKGRPFILSGQVGNDNLNGHTFICHGYSQGYYAVNWGWGGTANGYFAMEAMIGNGTDYSSELVACVNISPSGGNISNGAVFSLMQMEAVGSYQYYRNSASQPFNNVSFFWRLRNSLMQTSQYQIALAINKPDNSWDLLYTYNAASFDPTYNSTSSPTINISSQYGDGTYRITLLYREPSENTWHACQGVNWRYVEAVISGNTLTLTNYPTYDAPYPTGSYPDYPDPINPNNPDNPDNPDKPDNPDVTAPTNDVAFEYPTIQKEYKGTGTGFTIDWTALSTAMYGYLKMDETQFFDNFWVDCFTDDYEVPSKDARYVSPYAYNNNQDGSYSTNNYDMLIFNFGDDLFGNHGKLPDPEDAEFAEPEYDYIAIATFYPNYDGMGKHRMTFGIPQELMEYLLDGMTSPVTFTRWLRFACKTDDEGNSTAPFRYLWLKVSMEISWNSDPDGIKTITAKESDAPVYNLRGQRVDNNYKGIVIKNGKKHLKR